MSILLILQSILSIKGLPSKYPETFIHPPNKEMGYISSDIKKFLMLIYRVKDIFVENMLNEQLQNL